MIGSILGAPGAEQRQFPLRPHKPCVSTNTLRLPRLRIERCDALSQAFSHGISHIAGQLLEKTLQVLKTLSIPGLYFSDKKPGRKGRSHSIAQLDNSPDSIDHGAVQPANQPLTIETVDMDHYQKCRRPIARPFR